jgi:serine/threonine protein kinase
VCESDIEVIESDSDIEVIESGSDSDIEVIESDIESDIEVIESNSDSFDIIGSDGESIEVLTSEERSTVSSIEVMGELDNLLEETMTTESDSQPRDNSPTEGTPVRREDGDFELAVKMIYNYGVESNEQQILNAMKNEILLAERVVVRGEGSWEFGHPWKKQRLKPHPNILRIECAFVDEVPYVADSLDHYPASLPTRYNPEGCGRNMTLFLIMKKYPWTVSSYLEQHDFDLRQRLLLQAQLLEGVAHLAQSHVAHRDIKADNILLAQQEDDLHLVLGDFGCCLVSDWKENLRIPYTTEHVSKGGNAALSAPEIATAQPGWFSVLDFRKSDVWAAGAVAYEIFGAHNPFYRRPKTRPEARALDARTYTEEQLPDIPGLPAHVNAAIKLLLTRNHRKRPDARTAATMFKLLLWAPQTWFSQTGPPSKSHVAAWLRSLAVSLICMPRGGASSTPVSNVENFLKSSLATLDLNHVYKAVCLLHSLQN